MSSWREEPLFAHDHLTLDFELRGAAVTARQPLVSPRQSARNGCLRSTHILSGWLFLRAASVPFMCTFHVHLPRGPVRFLQARLTAQLNAYARGSGDRGDSNASGGSEGATGGHGGGGGGGGGAWLAASHHGSQQRSPQRSPQLEQLSRALVRSVRDGTNATVRRQVSIGAVPCDPLQPTPLWLHFARGRWFIPV